MCTCTMYIAVHSTQFVLVRTYMYDVHSTIMYSTCTMYKYDVHRTRVELI